MAKQLFVNLPVKDLDKSKEFFSKLGFGFNEQFTDENAACLIIGENIYAMLLTEPLFKTFTRKEISDARNSTEVLIAMDAGSRAEVDDLVSKARQAGESVYMEPMDQGWMYGHSFADLDGHQWEIIYMDMAAMPQA
ncbi:VOC family protein [Desulfocurvibacter africanus]|uniref:VOC family protein n=1 Tax=Desulfocurvibacter africanus TaxID=873 RepID=UPI0003FC51E1|nr:VOC family protein [Desulfocurvibacter africanus]